MHLSDKNLHRSAEIHTCPAFPIPKCSTLPKPGWVFFSRVPIAAVTDKPRLVVPGPSFQYAADPMGRSTHSLYGRRLFLRN